MRRYESMLRDQIHLAIAQEREMLAAIENYKHTWLPVMGTRKTN
jgi:hypothetical protein